MNLQDVPESMESRPVRIEVSPGESEYYIPECEKEFKPIVGMKFSSLEEGVEFYRIYASKCGFDIRLGPRCKSKDNVVVRRYVYCNREGVKHAECDESNDWGESSKKKRRRTSRRSECMARVVFRLCAGEGYEVNGFIECHTHKLVSDSYKQFMKVNRNLDFGHQNFVLNCARANIGAVKSYRVFKESVGSYANIGCSVVDFKNFARDMRAYVAGAEAQMILDKLFKKRELCPEFSFEYCVDENDKLTRLFWADRTSKKNYNAFGDVVSFDATYQTNKYNLVFTPFTGMDNHGKCVVFGAGLLNKEDVESYVWVLEKFNSCTKNAPTMLITDQDPALKIAVPQVFPHKAPFLHVAHYGKSECQDSSTSEE